MPSAQNGHEARLRLGHRAHPRWKTKLFFNVLLNFFSPPLWVLLYARCPNKREGCGTRWVKLRTQRKTRCIMYYIHCVASAHLLYATSAAKDVPAKTENNNLLRSGCNPREYVRTHMSADTQTCTLCFWLARHHLLDTILVDCEVDVLREACGLTDDSMLHACLLSCRHWGRGVLLQAVGELHNCDCRTKNEP